MVKDAVIPMAAVGIQYFGGPVVTILASKTSRAYNSIQYFTYLLLRRGRCGGLMVSGLDSGSNGPSSSPGWGHCVVFLGKTLYSHIASLRPGV